MSQGAGASLTYPALSKQNQKHFVGKRAEMRDLYGVGRLHTPALHRALSCHSKRHCGISRENWARDGIQGCPASLSSEDTLQQAGCDPEEVAGLTTLFPSLFSVVSLLRTLLSLLFPSTHTKPPTSLRRIFSLQDNSPRPTEG